MYGKPEAVGIGWHRCPDDSPRRGRAADTHRKGNAVPIKATIITDGPIIDGTFVDEQHVQSYVEQHVPMKRGWTSVWTSRKNRLTYETFNSKGKHQRYYHVVFTKR